MRGARKRDGTIGPPKNGKQREVAFLPPARVLDEVPRRPDPFVFHSPTGQPLVQGSHHYSWRAVRAAAGVPGIRWHDLRHFCATQLLELGLDHFAVSVQLGHEDGGALVMARYGHPSKDAARTRLLEHLSSMRTDLVARLVAAPAAKRMVMGFGAPINSISRLPRLIRPVDRKPAGRSLSGGRR